MYVSMDEAPTPHTLYKSIFFDLAFPANMPLFYTKTHYSELIIHHNYNKVYILLYKIN
jgi:hypothetical protein